jgi:hypothetical protein
MSVWPYRHRVIFRSELQNAQLHAKQGWQSVQEAVFCVDSDQRTGQWLLPHFLYPYAMKWFTEQNLDDTRIGLINGTIWRTINNIKSRPCLYSTHRPFLIYHCHT